MMRRSPTTRVIAAAGTLAAGGMAADAGTTPFTEEAAARGILYTMQAWRGNNHLGFGCGLADLDSDGDPDIVLLGAADGTVGLFENDGTGQFTDRSGLSGIAPLGSPSGLAVADYDGDGLLDLYLTQYGLANLLLHNEGGFCFTDQTAAAGVGDPGPGNGACFGDYNGDGRLDLYVCNYGPALPGGDNRLYRNLGNGQFEEVGAAQTVDDPGYGFQAVWTDFDRDGDVDLYLSNDKGHQPPFLGNQLWRNDGGRLVNVSRASGADVALYSMGLACGDFDGNGWPDFYCTNIPGGGGMDNPLLLNQGDGTFVESSHAAGVSNPFISWGAVFFDFDNNGHQDLYVNNMFDPNTLYANDGIFPVQEVGAALGVTANIGASFTSAVGDVDGDGDLDLLVNNLGSNAELFINHEGEQRSWVRYRVVGETPNRYAVGASVDTQVGAGWLNREVLAGGNGYLGQNELTLHVGLNAARVIDAVVVGWPGGGVTRTLTDLPAEETWTLYPPSRLGDADGNGTVSLDDFWVLAGCWDGGFSPGCEMMDFDGNSVIDVEDFNAFAGVYAGPLYDCDGNKVLDLLDILTEPEVDLDMTGIPDLCEGQGDLSGDGTVGINDFLILLANWGPCADPCPPSCAADLDDDCTVGITDFLLLLSNWG